MKLNIFLLSAVISIAPTSLVYGDLSLESQTNVLDSYSYEKGADLPKALEKMVHVLKAEPNDYFVHLRLGWLFFTSKKYKNSIDHYQRASQLKPESLEPLLGLSQVYMETENYDKTVGAVAQVIRKDPRNYTAIQRLLTAQIRLKDFKNALDYSSLAIKLYPTDATFLEQQAVIQKGLGLDQEAKTTLTQLLLISPQNSYARSLATIAPNK